MIKYEKYKHSEIEWLEQIPSHWQSHRIDWIASIVRGNTGFKKDELLDNGEYVALQYGKTYKVDEVNNTFNFYVNSNFYKQSQIVNLGDTILISTSETLEDLGHSCFYNRDKMGLLGGEQLLLKPNAKLVIEKYLYFNSKFFSCELQKYATGLKVFRFNIDDLKNISIALPPLNEQRQIVNFIDIKTQVIDKKINLLIKKTNYYKEYRKSIINEAVCKGLNKNVQYKNSGVEVFGDIPEHWYVLRLKSLGSIETSSVDKKIAENEDLIKLVNYTDVYGNLNKEIINNANFMIVSANIKQVKSKFLKKGDVLFTPSSETIEDIGVSAVVMEDLDNTLYSYHLLRLRFSKEVHLNFKKYLFNNDLVQNYLSKSATGTTRKILGLNTFNNIPLILPKSLKEQEEIAKYLDNKTQVIDKILSNISSQIITLKELRKTLINDVVTGKIKVTQP